MHQQCMSHHAGQLKKKSESNGWNFFAFIKKLKPLIIPMLAMWGSACHIMLATKKKSQSNGCNFLLLLKI